MGGLLPAWLRAWRCHSCGARHEHIWDICAYTNIPKDRP